MTWCMVVISLSQEALAVWPSGLCVRTAEERGSHIGGELARGCP